MKLFLLFFMLWGCIIIGCVHMWMEVTFPPVVQCHIGCAKLHKKCSLEKKA